MTLTEWLTFAAIWTLLSLPLGPNAINCITAGVSNGTRRALWTVLGIAIAGLTHMTIAILGFGTLLLAYAELYLVLKWLGIAYLTWLGISLWRKPATLSAFGSREMEASGLLVRRGFTISMSNPKAILSYMAAFPQFIDPDRPMAPQLLFVVPTAIMILAAVYGGYTAAGGSLARVLTSTACLRLFNRAAGGFYLVIAGLLAVADTRRA